MEKYDVMIQGGGNAGMAVVANPRRRAFFALAMKHAVTASLLAGMVPRLPDIFRRYQEHVVTNWGDAANRMRTSSALMRARHQNHARKTWPSQRDFDDRLLQIDESAEMAADQPMTFEQAVQAAVELDAPLNERLAVIAAAVRRIDENFADAVDRLVERLEKQGAGAAAPTPGDVMPPFLLPDDEGRLVGLADILLKGPAVITFQRGHWCPYCRLNAIGIVEVQQEIGALGGQIVAIMPERGKFARAMKSAVGASFPFLTDMDNGYALSLNLAIWIGAEMERLMGVAYDLRSYQGNSSWFLPIPATFIVGTDGVIMDRFVDPDYRRRMDIDDLIAALRRAR